MAKKRLAAKAPIDPADMVRMMRASGMAQLGNMMMEPSAIIASKMRKPSGRKSVGTKGRSK